MIKIIVVFAIFIVVVELQPVSPKSDCLDMSSNCKDQLKHKNYCKDEDESIRKFFLETCKKSCGLCPTCDDGVQNQNETGIDCGGPCPACGFCKQCNCWTCLNGGTCFVKNANPTCKCPPGFNGAHCHFKVVPTSTLRTTKISEKYPSTVTLSTQTGYPSTASTSTPNSYPSVASTPSTAKTSAPNSYPPTVSTSTTNGYPSTA